MRTNQNPTRANQDSSPHRLLSKNNLVCTNCSTRGTISPWQGNLRTEPNRRKLRLEPMRTDSTKNRTEPNYSGNAKTKPNSSVSALVFSTGVGLGGSTPLGLRRRGAGRGCGPLAPARVLLVVCQRMPFFDTATPAARFLLGRHAARSLALPTKDNRATQSAKVNYPHQFTLSQ